MPMRPGIHISNPAAFEDDGDDEYAAMSPAERVAELRENVAKHKARRDADARRPKQIGDLNPAEIYAKFNRRDGGKTLADDGE